MAPLVQFFDVIASFVPHISNPFLSDLVVRMIPFETYIKSIRRFFSSENLHISVLLEEIGPISLL